LLSAVVVIVSSGLGIVSVKVAVTLCDGVPASVTPKVSAVVPATNGVPPTTPVEGFNAKPNGSVPEVTCQL
jgi:hypothetical protein